MAFQATLELMAQQFPGAFAGYKLEVTESHQRQKADTSGTAKAVIASIAKLGAPISEVKPPETTPHFCTCDPSDTPSAIKRSNIVCFVEIQVIAMHVEGFGVRSRAKLGIMLSAEQSHGCSCLMRSCHCAG